MANFAVINDGLVENILVAESLEDAELASERTCIQLNAGEIAEIGWEFDGTKVINPDLVEEGDLDA